MCHRNSTGILGKIFGASLFFCGLSAGGGYSQWLAMEELSPSPLRGQRGFKGVAAQCQPILDVRHLVLLEYEGRRLRRPKDTSGLPKSAEKFGRWALEEICRSRPGPLQELAKFFRGPVMVAIDDKDEEVSSYSAINRVITIRSRALDEPSALYHEMAHVIFHDRIIKDNDLMHHLVYAVSESHDEKSFRDRDFVNAHTSLSQALDEGLAGSVRMAFDIPYVHQGAVDLIWAAKRPEWRSKFWEDQQSNEFFVALVLEQYLLLEGPSGIPSRLLKVVKTLHKAKPNNLQELLEGLLKLEPDREMKPEGPINRILADFGASWKPE